MKKAILLLAVLVIAAIAVLVWIRASNARKAEAEAKAKAEALAAALSPANAVVRIHFAGTANISSDTNSIAFTNIFCCSPALTLESQALDKLSRAPATWFKDKLPTSAVDGSALLRPLLDDFLRSEWVFELRDATSSPSPEYVLAIRLNDTRAQLWQTNLRTLLESWTKIKAQDITNGLANGWELKKDLPPNLFRIVHASGWLVIGCGQDELPLTDYWARSGGYLPEDETNWASAKVNWPRLAEIFPAFARFDLPAMKLQTVGQGGTLFTTGTFELSQPLPPLGQWQIPTNLIYQPLTSFTAMRGFAPWLERQPWAKRLQLLPEPDQAFIWSLGSYPLQTFLAIPVTNSVSALAQLGQNLADTNNWEKGLLNTFILDRKTNRISLDHVPFAGPEVQALKEPSGDFLFADVFPNPPRTNTAPPGLIQAVNRPNLVAYHWEFTGERLKELPQITQLALLLTRHRQLRRNSPSIQWFKQIGPALGQSITEVMQTGPTELSFQRSATTGFTAFELIALGNWLENPGFPGLDLSLPQSYLLPAPPSPQPKPNHPPAPHPSQPKPKLSPAPAPVPATPSPKH